MPKVSAFLFLIARAFELAKTGVRQKKQEAPFGLPQATPKKSAGPRAGARGQSLLLSDFMIKKSAQRFVILWVHT